MELAVVWPARLIVAAARLAATLLGCTTSFFVSTGLNSTSPACAGTAASSATATAVLTSPFIAIPPCGLAPGCDEPPPRPAHVTAARPWQRGAPACPRTVQLW